MKPSMLLFALLCYLNAFSANTGMLNVIGSVTELDQPLSAVRIEVLNDGHIIDNLHSSFSGQYGFAFELNKVYLMKFKKTNYQTVKLEVDTRVHTTTEPQDYSLTNVDLEMFLAKAIEDVSFFDEPVIRVHYNVVSGMFEFDQRLNASIQQELNQVRFQTSKFYDALSDKAQVFVDQAYQAIAVEDLATTWSAYREASAVCYNCGSVAVLRNFIEMWEVGQWRDVVIEADFNVEQDVIETANKVITRRTVTEADRVTEYFKVEHNWGGTYYFEQDQAITSWIWSTRTE